MLGPNGVVIFLVAGVHQLCCWRIVGQLLCWEPAAAIVGFLFSFRGSASAVWRGGYD